MVLSIYDPERRSYTVEERAAAWEEEAAATQEFESYVQERRLALLEILVDAPGKQPPIEVLEGMVNLQVNTDPETLARYSEIIENRRQWEIIDLRTPRQQEWSYPNGAS